MQITLASKITISRIVLIIPTVVVYVLAFLIPSAFLPLIIVSTLLYAILCSSDFIDGAVARKTHTVSDLGKFLDPLADKVVIVIMLFLMVWSAGCESEFFPNGCILFAYDVLVLAILGGLILSRELMISVFRAIAVRKGVVLAADIYGKLKTVFLDVGVALMMLAPIKTGSFYFFAWVGTILFYIGAALAVYSGLHYILANKQVFTDDDVKAEEPKQEKIETAEEKKAD